LGSSKVSDLGLQLAVSKVEVLVSLTVDRMAALMVARTEKVRVQKTETRLVEKLAQLSNLTHLACRMI